MKSCRLARWSAAVFALGVAGCASLTDALPVDAELESLSEVSTDAIVILENEFIRVTQVSLASGEDLPRHTGEQRIIYALNDYEILWRGESESPTQKHWKAGEAHFHDAGAHSLRNTGATDAEFLVFERLDADLAETADETVLDAAASSPDTTTLLLENEAFRVLRVELAPGEAQPVHGGRPRAIYSLSDYQIEWRETGEAVSTRSWNEGDIHWHSSGDHAAKNTGNTTARWLIVSLTE